MSEPTEPKRNNEQDRSLLRWINETVERMCRDRTGSTHPVTPSMYRFAQKLLLLGVKWGRENGPRSRPASHGNIYPTLRAVFSLYVPEFSERETLPDDWCMNNEAIITEDTWMDIRLELCSRFGVDVLDAPLEHMSLGETVAYLEVQLKTHGTDPA